MRDLPIRVAHLERILAHGRGEDDFVSDAFELDLQFPAFERIAAANRLAARRPFRDRAVGVELSRVGAVRLLPAADD